MAQRITRFSVAQTAKVFAVIYALVGLIFTPFFLIAGAMAPEGAGGVSTVFALAFPVIYAVVGYVGVALGCAIYNMVAGWVGGIEVELDQA